MRERPILFSAPMVRAILDGSKTMTRRVVKPQPKRTGDGVLMWDASHRGMRFGSVGMDVPPNLVAHCPYGAPGDRLWVRETFGIDDEDGSVLYFADPGTAQDAEHARACEDRYPRRRPSIHMPRWASRILLEIVSVRVERLQNISEDDARAEGIERGKDFPGWYRGPLDGDSVGLAEAGRHLKIPTAFPKLAFRALWESINGPDSWAANPWVWVVEFRRVETTEGA